MYDWVPVEAGLPDPMPGSVLEGTGLRVRGVLESVDPSAKEGLLLAEGKTSTIARVVEYDVTGHVVKANDFDVDVGHGGADVVLSVNGSLLHVQIDGWAREITRGSRLRVRGELLVIPDYEWDAFELVDVRGAWIVEESQRLLDGDLLLRLLPSSAAP
jgi:hypothetical protein